MTGTFILTVGILLLSGFLIGLLAERLGLPRVTGYLLTGILLNPRWVPYVPLGFIDSANPLVDLCLAFITFEVGFNLSVDKIKKHGKRLLLVSFSEAFGAFLIVFLAFLFLAPYLLGTISGSVNFTIAFSLLVAALASPTDPSATLAVMHQYKAKGEVTDTILGCAAFDDAFTLIIYSICFSAAAIVIADTPWSVAYIVDHGFISILGAIGVGVVIGYCFNRLTEWLSIVSEGQLFVILLAFISLAFGLCSLWHLDDLLGTLALGVMAANFNPQRKLLKVVIERYTEELIFIFFFVLSAMHLEFHTIGKFWPYILLFVLFRALGKFLGVFGGLSLTTSSKLAKKYAFSGLFPQGGIVMGLALMIQKNPQFDAFSSILVSTIMGATVVHEILGPIVTKWGLSKAGEMNNSEDI